MAPVQVDSRHYIIAYELPSNDEAPQDFGHRDEVPRFHAGLFLPRDSPDWFGRSSYPPRVLALVPSGLVIVPHPSSQEPAHRLSFERLSFIESGHILLRGWLRFVGHDFDRTLFYNTRGSGAVDGFMLKFRASFLAGFADARQKTAIEMGQPLDLKFSNALSHELDPGEAVLATLFRPARQLTRRLFVFNRRSVASADVMALTVKRLLWITDSYKGGYARYGSIARYARPANVVRILREWDGTERALRVLFDSGHQWQIPLAEEHWAQASWLESAFTSPEKSGFRAQPGP